MESKTFPKDYTKKTIEEDLAKVAAFFKSHDLDGELSIRSIYYAQGGSKFQKTKSVIGEVELPYSEKSKVSALQKDLNKDPFLKKAVEIKCHLKVGDKFPEISDVDKPLGTEGLSLTHTPGTVMLVDFWATWCGPCQEPMAHNQQMLVKNANKWGDKVKIVGLSLDQDVMQLINRIKERGWNKVEHYILPGGFKHSGPVAYDCHGIPFVVLVDKNGTIVYTGHPQAVDLEKLINKHLEAKEGETFVASKPKYESESGTPVEIYKKLRTAVKDGKVKVPPVFNQSQMGPKTTPTDLVFQSAAVLIHSRKFTPDLKKLTVERQKLVLQGEMSQPAAIAFIKGTYEATAGVPQGYVVPRIKPVQVPMGPNGECKIF